MASAKSLCFPYEQKPYSYDGAELHKAWDRLHKGDREPHPDALALQQAWRAFHRGDFSEAIAQGSKQGGGGRSDLSRGRRPPRAPITRGCGKARGGGDAQAARSRQCLVHAGIRPRPVCAAGLDRQGAGGRHRRKVRNALDRALELEPKHADAHIALGLYHAEIIDKVGALAITEVVMNTAYRMFPDSAAAKGDQGEKKPEMPPTKEAVMFASILRGVHW